MLEPKSSMLYQRWLISFLDDAYDIAKLVKRQSGTGTSDAPILSTGAIIGIACGAGALLFAVLITIVVTCVRRRHKRKRASRKLDLSDDVDDIRADMRCTRPPQPDFTRGDSSKGREISGATSPEWVDGDSIHGPQLVKPALIPPPYAFHITGLRDSWPLVSWSKSPTLPLTSTELSDIIPISSANLSRSMDEPSSSIEYPPPAHMKPGRFEPPPPAGSKLRSSHSAHSSISSLRKNSLNRRSMSDNQLTSILRSTSQRLRDAQRPRMSRTLSVLSQVSGIPPSEKAPSPPKTNNNTSREGLVDIDDVEASYAESVKSSVLEMFNRTPSPAKMVARSAGSVNRARASPIYDSDDDSLCGATPDLVIPKNLTSPTKRGIRHEERHKMRILSGETTKIHEDSRASFVAFGGRDIFTQGSPQNLSSNDPFIDNIPAPVLALSGSVKTRKSKTQRKTTFGQENGPVPSETEDSSDNSAGPLRTVTGNQISPIVDLSRLSEVSDAQQNLFQWSEDPASNIKSQGGVSKSTLGKQKGHKRSNVIRMSGLPHPSSVSVLHEESEEGSPTNTKRKVSHNPPIYVDASVPASPSSEYSRSFSTRPPSVATFTPFVPISTTTSLSVPNTSVFGGQGSHASYSATLSLYDCYTSFSDTDGNFNEGASIEPTPVVRSPSSKKASRHGRNFSLLSLEPKDYTNPPGQTQPRRHARNFSMASSTIDEGGPLTSFPPLTLSKATTPVLLPSPTRASSDSQVFATPPQVKVLNFTKYGVTNFPTSAPPVVSRLHGPRSLPRPADRGSVQHSIGLLRRMNSETSAYSTSASEVPGSPTLPAFRGGGISPVKSFRRGSSNYLAMGANGTGGSPSARKRGRVINDDPGRQRDRAPQRYRELESRNVAKTGANPGMTQSDREFYATLTPQGSDENAVGAAFGNALGLKMPVIQIDEYAKSPSYKREERWSDVMTKPMNRGVRHTSRMEMPSPKLPPKGGWEKKIKDDEGQERRDSIGLYDENGFLRSSPERGRGDGGLI